MRYSKRTAVILTALVIGGVILSDVDRSTRVMTVEATSTQQKIDQTTQEKNELENKLGETQENLEGLKNEQNTLKGQLKNLNQQLTQVGETLADLERQIGDKEQEIADTQAALEEAKTVEENQYTDMVVRVRKMYERNDTSYFSALINAVMERGKFAEALDMADTFETIETYDKMKLSEYKENKRLIEEREALLQTEKIELDALKVAAEAEKNKVSGLISQTSTNITMNANEISEAEAAAAAYEAEIKKKEDDLEYLRKKLAQELALSKAAANAAWRDISEVSFADGDRYLLANLIYCEAGAEPYAGKLAVGSVVINRVLSSKYPDSVVGVIYQSHQFSPVGSGRLDLALTSNRANAQCYQAADEAMSGVTNVGNCVYFRTPIPGLEGISIGGHIFY